MLITAERLWTCPNCTVEHVTRQSPQPDVVLHVCAGLRGLRAPFVLAGTRAKVEAREREDYIGHNPMVPDVRRDENGVLVNPGGMVPAIPLDGDGRPVMSIVTTKDNSEDVMVLAPTVTRSRND